ncbi:MAG: TIGR01777 family oxidoreductase [Flavobacteriaceae bacterium]|nr:TIGR01777 family oxidoreductase [Flavobacteriaceae bacterium]
MKILISGGTGLVGKKLVAELHKKGHSVNILVRRKTTKTNEFYWNIEQQEIDEKAFDNIDAIIHLAGANIGKKWTSKYQKQIYSSRINSANLLHNQCEKLGVHLKSFISAGGINYYGTFTSNAILTEESSVLHQDFLSDVCQKWEDSAYQFSTIADRVVVLRTSPVLAKQGGFYEPIKNMADFHLSSGLGSGKQWFNWIHIDDLVNMYLFAVENDKMKGSFNAVADDIPTNKDFMKAVAKSRAKWFFPINVPAFLLKLVLGKMSEMLLKGTRVSNEKIKPLGFDFTYNTLEETLKNGN